MMSPVGGVVGPLLMGLVADLSLIHIFHAGESAIKECSNIEAVNCRFEGNYPFWYVHGFVIDRCFFDVGGRSALWYSDYLKTVSYTNLVSTQVERSSLLNAA